MNAAVRAVVFDLDGTLVDSITDITTALNETLAGAGHPTHPRAAIAQMVGDGAASLVERAAPPGADHAALLAAFKQHYGAGVLTTTCAFPGIVDLLATLTARGVPLAVLSNKPDAMTQKVVRALFADVPWRDVIGQRQGVPIKPDPTVAVALAECLGVPPAHCALVGDSEADVQAGRAAGMTTIAVTWGFRSRDVLSSESPDALVDTVEALRGVLLGGDHPASNAT